MNTTGTCIVDDCSNPVRVKSRGLCAKHYSRFQRHGDPTAGRTPDGEPLALLMSVIGTDSRECIPWPYGRNPAGHGTIYYKGQMMAVGRAVCLEAHGEPPEGKPESAHDCGRGHEGCFNPNHLYWASKAENYRDRVTHGVSQRGSKHGQAKLTESDVREIRTLCANGMSRSKAAAKFGVARQTVNSVVWRHIWSWVA